MSSLFWSFAAFVAPSQEVGFPRLRGTSYKHYECVLLTLKLHV